MNPYPEDEYLEIPVVPYQSDMKREDALQLFEKYYPSEYKLLNKDQYCIQCGRQFKEIDNYDWPCQMHSERLDEETQTYYTCCNQAVTPQTQNYVAAYRSGCVLCSHISKDRVKKPYQKTETTRIPYLIKFISKINKDSIRQTKIDPKNLLKSFIEIYRREEE